MKTSILACCAVLMISFGSLTFANDTSDPGVNKRQHAQKHRIVNGVKSGELTFRETRKLAKQQRRINKRERAYKSDGHLTKRERKNLHRAQNRASRNIYRQKHDAQRR